MAVERSQMKSDRSRPRGEAKPRSKRERLEAKGWAFGSAPEFLGLSEE